MIQMLVRRLSFLALMMTWSMSSNANCTAVGGMGPMLYIGGATPVVSDRYFSWTGAQAPVMAIGYMTTGTMSGNACVGMGCNLYVVQFRCQTFSTGKLGSFIFAQSMQATADKTSNVCTFSTAMGATCRIRGADGLPVELMEFSIEVE